MKFCFVLKSVYFYCSDFVSPFLFLLFFYFSGSCIYCFSELTVAGSRAGGVGDLDVSRG